MIYEHITIENRERKKKALTHVHRQDDASYGNDQYMLRRKWNSIRI